MGIQKVLGGRRITLPEDADLEIGDLVDVKQTGKQIIITPMKAIPK
jgi:virulence-associated protein VagC